MALKHRLSKYHILAFFYLVIFILSFIIPANASTTIGFQERYYDSVGVAHDFNIGNLAEYPMYTQVETPDNYWISRQGATIYLPKKSWIEYQFYPERIVPIYKIDNFSQISGLVTKVNESAWYLSVPFSAYSYKSITDDLIDMGVFKRTTKISVMDSNTTCGFNEFMASNCSIYSVVPKVIDNNIRLYFNPQNFSNVVYPLFLTENTVTVNNATFWANQDCGTGFWSAYGGGSCGTPLNDSIYASLMGYWDMESTIGYEHGINKFGRFPNNTIYATFYGNTTLNYTTGQHWGNALKLDGTNDYLQVSVDNSFNSSYVTISVLFNATNNTLGFQKSLVSKSYTANLPPYYQYGGFLLDSVPLPDLIDGEFAVSGIETSVSKTNTGYNYSEWNHLMTLYNGSKANVYLNDSLENTVLAPGSLSAYNTGIEFGCYRNNPISSQFCYNGSMDEVVLDSSGNPIYSTSKYSTIWNKTFSNNTATAGHVISAVKFNIYNLNVQNNAANISTRQNGTSNWTLINSSYVSDTWLNQTYWNDTDFVVNLTGNGSSRSFIISMTYDESPLPPPTTLEIIGYVNNTLGAFVNGALVTINGASALSRNTFLVNNTDLCNFNHTSMLCDGSRQSGVNYTATTNLQLIVFAHANAINTTADVIVNIDGTNVTYNTGRPLGGAEQSYKSAVIIVPRYSNYTVYFSNYHHYEWREYPEVHGYYNLTSNNGTQSVLAQQIGYVNFTGSLNVTSNMTYNITLSESSGNSTITAPGFEGIGILFIFGMIYYYTRMKR